MQGNYEIGIEAQNRKSKEEAQEKINSLKQKEEEMLVLTTVEVIKGRVTVKEFIIPKCSCIQLTPLPSCCLIRQIYYDTYGITLNNEDCGIIIGSYKNSVRTEINKEYWLILGDEIERFYLSTII